MRKEPIHQEDSGLFCFCSSFVQRGNDTPNKPRLLNTPPPPL